MSKTIVKPRQNGTVKSTEDISPIKNGAVSASPALFAALCLPIGSRMPSAVSSMKSARLHPATLEM